jgi:uncharacterized RDD family membrane protein YckC
VPLEAKPAAPRDAEKRAPAVRVVELARALDSVTTEKVAAQPEENRGQRSGVRGRVDLAVGEEIPAVPAPVALRVVSWSIDLALLGGLLYAYLRLVPVVHPKGLPPPSLETGIDYLLDRAVAWRRWLVPGIAGLVLVDIAYTAITVARLGRTLGGWVMRLYVVNGNGRQPEWPRSILRAVAGTLSAACALMGFWLIAFIPSRRALHDLLAKTYVVRKA